MLYSCPNDKGSDLLVKHHTLAVKALLVRSSVQVSGLKPRSQQSCSPVSELRARSRSLTSSFSIHTWLGPFPPSSKVSNVNSLSAFPPRSHLPLTSNVYFNLLSFMNDTEHLFTLFTDLFCFLFCEFSISSLCQLFYWVDCHFTSCFFHGTISHFGDFVL